MKKILLSLLLALTLLPARGQLRLVGNGRLSGDIVLASGEASDHERQAAQILQRFLGEATGSQPRISPKNGQKGILVMKDLSVRTVSVKQTDLENRIGEDGYRLTVTDRNVTLEGEGKGLVYGAVEFLKHYLDIDYWGGGEAYVPACRELTLQPQRKTVNPTFRYRQSQNYQLKTDPLYKVWYHLEEPQEVFAANYWVHTCDRLLPASRYGKEHPEYYAFYNGQRNPGSASQWCLSNPEVLEIVCARVDSLFKAYPDHNMISISQNDGSDTYCRCPDCTRIMEEEGGPSGPILRFINAVADRFPDKQISTLAYLFSVQPPKKTVPRPNVSIMLCDIDCRRQTALTENPSGQEFMRALEGWSRICDNLFVWDYGINFDNYLSPFPNFGTIKANMDIFRTHGVKMHFSQIASERGGDMAELRTYLVANLMWDGTAALDSLERRFLDRYYGTAGRPLYKYIQLMEGAAVGTDVDLFIYDSPVSYKDNILKPALLRRYNALFDEAEALVADDPVRLARVRRSRLPLQYSALEIARTDPDRDFDQLRKDLALFEQRTAQFNVPTLNERSNAPADYCQLYRERYLSDVTANLAFGKPVSYLINPRPKYLELSKKGLTDGIFGGTTFVENWIGWEGTDGAFVIDLQQEMPVRSISTDFLKQLGAWILLPKQVRYSVSTDGSSFKGIACIDLPEDRGIKVEFIPVVAQCNERARYIKVEVTGTKTCPPWHYGVGNPCWFFIDEVLVR